MEIYARVRGIKRLIITVPLLTPRVWTQWVNLVAPGPSGIVGPLVEGLRNQVICRENRIRKLIPIKPTSLEQSICNASREIEKGRRKLISRQECFLQVHEMNSESRIHHL